MEKEAKTSTKDHFPDSPTKSNYSQAPLLDAPREFCVPLRSPIGRLPTQQPKECFSAYGYTDAAYASESKRGSDARSVHEGYAEHQSRLPRLPIPSLEETSAGFLRSIAAIVPSEKYFVAEKLMEEFKRKGGVGEQLQTLLCEWDAKCGQPSWLEEFWDDAYLLPRDPIPINVNYFFGFSAHPVRSAMTQIGRAASLLHGAVSYFVDIRDGTLPHEYERDKPVCMTQRRFLCCTSRLPGSRRDRKVCYSDRPALSPDELQSKSVEYVKLSRTPKHCVVIMRNRYFSVNVLHPDGTQIDVQDIVAALLLIEERVTQCDDAGPPVGLLTTMNRTEWFEAREHLKLLGNYDTLRAIQSAIICIALDSINVVTSDEAARIFLHGSGTNRWFDRHNIIVTRDGWAGVNWEHSASDGTASLRMADRMYQTDTEHTFSEEILSSIRSNSSLHSRAEERVKELEWHLDARINETMSRAFADYKRMIEVNETAVLRFRNFGGQLLKDSNISPDAFVQMALQLAYYRMFGRSGGTYEAASTRTFLHGRTECVRSATQAALDFCKSAADPIFSKRFSSIVPTQRILLREAMKQHVESMKRAKEARGIDRHLLGLRLQAVKHGIKLPAIFTDPVFEQSAHWYMSTSHCGSSSLSLFGFGPVVGDGFGIGYMIKNDHIDFCVTSKFTDPFKSSDIFVTIIQSSLLHMASIVRSESVHKRAEARTLLFAHPTGFNDFKYDPDEGFVYKSFSKSVNQQITCSPPDQA